MARPDKLTEKQKAEWRPVLKALSAHISKGENLGLISWCPLCVHGCPNCLCCLIIKTNRRTRCLDLFASGERPENQAACRRAYRRLMRAAGYWK